VVRDRAAETSTTTTKHLWDIVIEAYERKEKEAAIFKQDVSFIKKFLLLVKLTLQKAIYNLVENSTFVLFVAAVIIFSVVLLQLDPPTEPILDPSVRRLIDLSLLIFFASEVGMRMFAYGVFSPSGVSPKTAEFPAGKPAFFSSTGPQTQIPRP